MTIFANRRIKRLFVCILASALLLTLAAVLLSHYDVPHAEHWLLVCVFVFVVLVLALCYHYFSTQQRIMEEAVSQIRRYLDGDTTASIDAGDEGELYRLFHEVNTLVAVLNAHVENEQRAKGFLKDTIADISHQLKTPLAALNIYNGLILDDADATSTIQDFSRLSADELERIETLVQNLLKITKLDAGTIVLDKKEENIAELAATVQRLFSVRAAREGKSLTLSGPDSVLLYCDRSWLIEALSNLVKNALDHTQSGDTITLSWQGHASLIQIRVQDNGSGIHPKDLHHIFKRFYRSRFSKDTQGIGLGLSLTKAIVDAHDGTIEVDSELGHGSTFTMNFLIPTKL